MKLIEVLKNLNYLRTPCRKCLVKPICKINCDELEKHYEVYHFIGDHDSVIIISIEIFLRLGFIIFLLMRG